jgi:nitroreductase
MEFADVVRKRKMVRNYDPDRPVPAEVVERILKHATHAPSAGFSQGWGFLVLQSQQERDRFWEATTPEEPTLDKWLANMKTAPLIIVALSNKSAYLARYAEQDKGWTDRDENRWPVPYWDIDTGMASLLMLLTVVDEGLGACFFGIQPAQTAAFKGAFGVPEEFTPVGVVTVGYRRSDDLRSSARRGRRPLDEVVHFGQWNQRASLSED